MRTARFIAFLSILLLSFAVSASAQRTRKPAPRATPKPTPVRATINPAVSAAKQRVSNQLHNVNLFVDVMGPAAVTIESRDKDAAARRLKKEEIAENDLNKRKLVAAIRGLRDGLVALETEFRTRPELAQYLPKIQGISTLCTQAEDDAIAGRFVASKEPLRQAALKLNETLAVLPGPLAAGSTYSSPPSRTVSNTTPTTSTTAGRDVAVGMTAAEVLQSVWGAPSNKRTSQSTTGTTEVWTYPGNKTLYFYNGKVTRIVR